MDLSNARIAPIFTKLVKPIPELEVNFTEIGLYGLPEQYFTDSEVTDFEYSFHFSKGQHTRGLVKKRLKTEEELWKEEQFKLTKGKKRKKGEEIPKEELEKLAYFAEVNKLDQERLAQLGERERFYNVKEDEYKNDCLVWNLEPVEIELGEDGEPVGENFENTGKSKNADGKMDTARISKEKTIGNEESNLGTMVFGMQEEEVEEPEPAFTVNLVNFR